MPRPIRFLHLTTFYPPWSFGGDAVYVRRLSHALADAGHEVDVVHCLDAFHVLHPGPPEYRPPEHPNVRVHTLRSKTGALGPLVTHQTGYPMLYGRALREVLGARQYDVVHYHNVSLLGPGVLRMTVPAGRPLRFYTAHEHWLVCPTHVLWQGDQRCEQPSCFACVLRARRPPQLWRYTSQLQTACAEIDQFIAFSRSSADVHAARGFGYPMAELPAFVDRDAQADQHVRPHPRPYALFVGRLETIKGLHTVLAAWAGLEIDLLIAGSGSQAAALTAQAAGDPRVRFLGQVPAEQLAPLYAHALACIVPSLTYETFGIITIEAFARRTPVIVRDIGALNEIVAQSGGGMVYRTDEELRQAVRRLAADPGLRERLGAQGHAAFERLWTREAHLAAYDTLLRTTARRVLGTVPWDRAPS